MNRFSRLFVITMVVLLAATGALAGSRTSSMAVSATISSSCVITAHPLAFGTYDPLGVNASTDATQTTTVTVQCVEELPATITLDQGLYPGTGSTATVPLRRMQCFDANQDYLNYFLYRDAAHTLVWGANTNSVTITGDGAPHDYTAYAVLPAGQIQESGGFADTVVATVSY